MRYKKIWKGNKSSLMLVVDDSLPFSSELLT